MDGVPKFGSKGSKGSLTLIQSRGIDIIVTRGRESGVMIILSFSFNKEISYGRRRGFEGNVIHLGTLCSNCCGGFVFLIYTEQEGPVKRTMMKAFMEGSFPCSRLSSIHIGLIPRWQRSIQWTFIFGGSFSPRAKTPFIGRPFPVGLLRSQPECNHLKPAPYQ